MEGDAKDHGAMAGTLKNVCMRNLNVTGEGGPNGMGIPITQCADNMGASIAKYSEAIGGYDFIALQEASNLADLRLADRGISMKFVVQYGSHLPYSYTRGIHVGEPKQAWVSTLYDENAVGKRDMAIAGALPTAVDRPFLILIFDAAEIMFINVHSMGAMRDPGSPSFADFADEMHARLKKRGAFEEKPARRDYRTILAGDFNDLDSHLPGCIRLPWNKAVMRLNSAKPIPKSCCQMNVGMEPTQHSDYIFDSWGVAENRVPSQYDKNLGQSDHWPIEGVLVPTQGTTELPSRCRSSARKRRDSGRS